jgi:hypothetical protein
MSDEHVIDDDGTDEEMEQRLRAYAAARLSPSSDAVARLRAAIVARAADAAAVEGFEARRAAMRDTTGPSAFERTSPRWWRLPTRRAVSALLASALLVGSAAAVLAATPGSALYGPRLWIEGLTLPASGDARAAAQVTQLDKRIADVQAAALVNDPAAVTAALSAFETELTTAVVDAADNAARLEQLETALGKHIVVLTSLEGTVPAQAVNAIGNAIDASSRAIDVIEARLARAPGGPTPGHTAPPHPTPRPTPDLPDKTPAPERTPAPHPSHPDHP